MHEAWMLGNLIITASVVAHGTSSVTQKAC
jgi:hypothetical protein